MQTRIAVFGVGRIGAVTAVGLSHLLHDVTGIDPNSGRIEALAAGDLPEAEPALRAALQSALRLRSIRFVEAIPEGPFDVAFLCVDTPPGPGGEPDMSQIFAAAEAAAGVVVPGGILVTRSTTPPGSGDRLQAAMRTIGRPDIQVVHMPEFLREGRAWEDFYKPDRLVIGAEKAGAATRVRALFSGLDCTVFETTRRTAELAKYAANAFLATSISFANEMADLGIAIGADTATLFDIVRADSRIGHQAYLTPGLGFGGHCLPKDTAALDYVAAIHGLQLHQLRATSQVNSGRVTQAVAWLRAALQGLEGQRIAIGGLAFKPGTDDVRAAPAFALARSLHSQGARVVGFDPAAKETPPFISRVPSIVEAIRGADALVLSHRLPQVEEIPPPEAAALMQKRVLFDAPGLLETSAWRAAGFVTNRPACTVTVGAELVTER